MLKLNIKNLWIQQIGDDGTPVEIKVVEDVSIELEGDEIQFYNRMMEKIIEDIESNGRSWQGSLKKVELELPEEWDMDCEIPEMENEECESHEEENSMDLDEE